MTLHGWQDETGKGLGGTVGGKHVICNVFDALKDPLIEAVLHQVEQTILSPHAVPVTVFFQGPVGDETFPVGEHDTEVEGVRAYDARRGAYF